MTDVRETGLNVFRELLPGLIPDGRRSDLPRGGFADELFEISVDNVFGRLWGRDGLSRRDRSLLTLGMLIALRAPDELAIHFKIARTNGLTDDEIAEVIYHSSGYAGFPARRLRTGWRSLGGSRNGRSRPTRVRKIGEIGVSVCTHRSRKRGATWGNRTPDLFITSESLYRLS